MGYWDKTMFIQIWNVLLQIYLTVDRNRLSLRGHDFFKFGSLRSNWARRILHYSLCFVVQYFLETFVSAQQRLTFGLDYIKWNNLLWFCKCIKLPPVYILLKKRYLVSQTDQAGLFCSGLRHLSPGQAGKPTGWPAKP